MKPGRKAAIGRIRGELSASAPPQERALARSTAAQLAEQAPQVMREYLAPFAHEFCDSLMETLRHPTLGGAHKCPACEAEITVPAFSNPSYRTALSLYPQILRAIGSSDALTAAIIAQLGGSLDRARDAVEMLNGLPEDVDAIYRECRRMCDWYEGENGPGRGIVPDERKRPV